MANKPYKPGPNHPWNRRVHEQVLASRGKKRTAGDVLVFESLREEEERHDREEVAELERSIREFFE